MCKLGTRVQTAVAGLKDVMMSCKPCQHQLLHNSVSACSAESLQCLALQVPRAAPSPADLQCNQLDSAALTQEHKQQLDRLTAHAVYEHTLCAYCACLNQCNSRNDKSWGREHTSTTKLLEHEAQMACSTNPAAWWSP